jgi:hypothetical protein
LPVGLPALHDRPAGGLGAAPGGAPFPPPDLEEDASLVTSELVTNAAKLGEIFRLLLTRGEWPGTDSAQQEAAASLSAVSSADNFLA